MSIIDQLNQAWRLPWSVKPNTKNHWCASTDRVSVAVWSSGVVAIWYAEAIITPSTIPTQAPRTAWEATLALRKRTLFESGHLDAVAAVTALRVQATQAIPIYEDHVQALTACLAWQSPTLVERLTEAWPLPWVARGDDRVEATVGDVSVAVQQLNISLGGVWDAAAFLPGTEPERRRDADPVTAVRRLRDRVKEIMLAHEVIADKTRRLWQAGQEDAP